MHRPDRLSSIDAFRGLIMVLMALDHASFLIAQVHPFEFWAQPLPVYGDAGWFFTRWLTHLCAPGFFFTMGIGFTLFAASRKRAGWDDKQITTHLVGRGLILLPLSYAFEWLLPAVLRGAPLPPGSYVLVNVLGCLGLSMCVCAPLLRLSTRAWLALALAAVMTPNFLLPLLNPSQPVGPWLTFFVVAGLSRPVIAAYPLLPWLGICALGVGFGRLVLANRERAMRALLPMSAAYLIAYMGLRIGGGFGNLRLSEGSDWMAFLTVVKYPPSLAFVLLTLGLDMALLTLLHRAGAWLDGVRSILSVFGQTPLFFYVVHFYLYGLAGALLFGKQASPRWALYACWVAGVGVMYVLCAAYRRFKFGRPAESWWRML